MEGTARRLTIFVGESDQWHHKPLYAEIVHRAHAAKLAGATVMRGLEGFGASHLPHTSRIVSLSEDLPCMIVIIDSVQRIEEFMSQLDEVIDSGLVVLDDIDVNHYGNSGDVDSGDAPAQGDEQ